MDKTLEGELWPGITLCGHSSRPFAEVTDDEQEIYELLKSPAFGHGDLYAFRNTIIREVKNPRVMVERMSKNSDYSLAYWGAIAVKFGMKKETVIMLATMLLA